MGVGGSLLIIVDAWESVRVGDCERLPRRRRVDDLSEDGGDIPMTLEAGPIDWEVVDRYRVTGSRASPHE